MAESKKLLHATNHNLRYYPMVQQVRQMIAAGELGEILVVQGTYSQDWLLYETDFNWRILKKDNGPLRVVGDIGSASRVDYTVLGNTVNVEAGTYSEMVTVTKSAM